MTIDSAAPPQFGVLELHFFNDQHLEDLVTAASTPAAMWALVPVIGGDRILAGPMSGQVQVTKVLHSAPQGLQVTIAPVGDYNRYTLKTLQPGFAPTFWVIFFRFRLRCVDSDCS